VEWSVFAVHADDTTRDNEFDAGILILAVGETLNLPCQCSWMRTSEPCTVICHRWYWHDHSCSHLSDQWQLYM